MIWLLLMYNEIFYSYFPVSVCLFAFFRFTVLPLPFFLTFLLVLQSLQIATSFSPFDEVLSAYLSSRINGSRMKRVGSISPNVHVDGIWTFSFTSEKSEDVFLVRLGTSSFLAKPEVPINLPYTYLGSTRERARC